MATQERSIEQFTIAETDSLRRLKAGMVHVEYKVALAGTARGVGVSTVATNLALALRQASREGEEDALLGNPRIGILHLDAGSKPNLDRLGIAVLSSETNSGGTDWRLVQESLATVDWKKLDVLLVELPVGIEGVGDLSEVFPTLDAAVIVTLPSGRPRDRIRTLWKFFDASAVPVIGLVTNMEGRFTGEDVEELGRTFGIPIRVSIPYESALAVEGSHDDPYVLARRDTHASQTLFGFSEDLADYLIWLHDEHEQEEDF